MELKKIYVVSRWSLFSLPPKIETRYIKRETEKMIFVCTNPDGSGWENSIRKSEMSVYDKYFCYTHADAIKKIARTNGKKDYKQQLLYRVFTKRKRKTRRTIGEYNLR